MIENPPYDSIEQMQPDAALEAAVQMLADALDPAAVAAQAARLFVRGGSVASAVRVLIESSEVHEHGGDFRQAMECLDQVMQIGLDGVDGVAADGVLLRRALIATNYVPERAAQCWIDVRSSCELAGDANGVARALYHLYWIGDDSTAAGALDSAVDLGVDEHGWASRAAALRCIIEVRCDEALALDQKTLRLARAAGDRQLEALTMLGIGVCYAIQGRMDDAIAAQRRGVALAIAERDHRAAVTARLNLLHMLVEQLATKDALREARALVAYIDEHQLVAWQAEAATQLAAILVAAGQVPDAQRVLADRRHAASDTHSISAAFVAINQAAVVLDSGIGPDPRQLIDIVARAAETFGLADLAAEAQFALARIESAAGDRAAALVRARGLDTKDTPGFAAGVALWLVRDGLRNEDDAFIAQAQQVQLDLGACDSRLVALAAQELAAIAAAQESAATFELALTEDRWRAAGRPLDAAAVAISIGVIERSADALDAADEAFSRAHRSLVEMGALAQLEWVANQRAEIAAARTGGSASNRLDESELLAGVGARERNQVTALAVTRSFASGQLFYSPDDENGAVYVLRSGRVRLYSITEDGKRLTVALLDPGAVFGENALLGRATAGLHAEADEDVVADVLPAERMRELVQRVPRIGLNLLQLVGDQLHRSHELAHQVAFWTVDRRIVRLLIELDERYGHPTLSGGRLINRVFTHTDLAEMVNARRETVGEFLKQLRNDGIIETRKRRIVINDVAALRAKVGLAGAIPLH